MKTYRFAAVALIIALASPALAQSKGKKERGQGQSWQSSQSGQSDRRSHSPNAQWDVYRGNGEYAGSDPDPGVRTKLFFDDPTNGDS